MQVEHKDIYRAYAELETAAEQFYAAAEQLAKLVPSVRPTMDSVAADVNFAVTFVDSELDQII